MLSTKNMRKFDTRTQYFRYEVLREVARMAWDGTLLEEILDIPMKIIPGKKPTMRCCVFKERAIVSEQVKMAMGGNPDNDNVIEVMEIACDECPVGGYEVGQHCRGCLAHRCADACKLRSRLMSIRKPISTSRNVKSVVPVQRHVRTVPFQILSVHASRHVRLARSR